MKKIVTNITDGKYWQEEILEERTPKMEEWNLIEVYEEYPRQKWDGMGGAITSASAYLYSLLDEKGKNEILKSYYSEEGLNYNLGRVAIGSCDFARSSYQYQEKNGAFSVQNDQEIITLLKQILKQKSLTLLASPWSPPDYMKTNQSRVNGGHLKKEYYEEYVRYIVAFVEAYQKEGISISYLTMQNEPLATQRWESCLFSIEEQKEFLQNYLIPKCENLKLFLWDHNKDQLVNILKNLHFLSDKIIGVAFHNYTGIHAENIELCSKIYPNYLFYQTEGCTSFSVYEETSWRDDAEYYLIDFIENMNHGLNGYIDWNILLNTNGGPNWQENYCKSPILIDENTKEIIKTPIYYYLGHIAKFFPKDCQIISISKARPDLFVVACKTKTYVNTTILNVLHYDIPITLKIQEHVIDDVIQAHSIVTYSLKKEKSMLK